MFIKEMAERTGLTDDTLRYYERIGLLPPVPRKRGGIRMYNDSHVRYVEVIQCLKASGMSLEHIQEYMELARQGEATAKERKHLIMANKQQLMTKIRQMQEALKTADFQLLHYDTSLRLQSECAALAAWQ